MIRFLFKTILFFIFTAVITLGLLAFYTWTRNPYNVRNCLVGNYFASKIKQADEIKTQQNKATSSQTIFEFSDQQKSALEKAGLKTESLPVQSILNKEDCFKQKIGEDRVKEIKSGSVPTAMEIFKSKDCF